MTAVTLPAWVDDATCSQTDLESYFPEKGTNATLALRLCEGCPVRVACLEYALAFERQGGIAFGIYGGMTAGARTKLLRKDRRCRDCMVSIPQGRGMPWRCEECRTARHRAQQEAYTARRIREYSA